jgi:flagellar biosynthesis anti-sigma factor FlgM
MRIDLNNISFQGVERDDKTRKAGSKPSSAPSVEDTTSLSVGTLSIASITSKAMTSPQIRQDRVDALRQSIQSGDYKVEADQVAHAILNQNQR